MRALPLDMKPFTRGEFVRGSADVSTSSAGAVPSSLQRFSRGDPPPQRPRVSGFMTPENTENDNNADEDDFAPESRGYSWQQASQKSETSFLCSTPDESPAIVRPIFSKLKQLHQSNRVQREPDPLPPVVPG